MVSVMIINKKNNLNKNAQTIGEQWNKVIIPWFPTGIFKEINVPNLPTLSSKRELTKID